MPHIFSQDRTHCFHIETLSLPVMNSIWKENGNVLANSRAGALMHLHGKGSFDSFQVALNDDILLLYPPLDLPYRGAPCDAFDSV